MTPDSASTEFAAVQAVEKSDVRSPVRAYWFAAVQAVEKTSNFAPAPPKGFVAVQAIESFRHS